MKLYKYSRLSTRLISSIKNNEYTKMALLPLHHPELMFLLVEYLGLWTKERELDKKIDNMKCEGNEHSKEFQDAFDDLNYISGQTKQLSRFIDYIYEKENITGDKYSHMGFIKINLNENISIYGDVIVARDNDETTLLDSLI